ncbi:MAG: hypothetical protein JWM11_3238 [Planctomycetaceae bacterium]|nr:hypothetical protein [Planctomycetaceae bacterium]
MERKGPEANVMPRRRNATAGENGSPAGREKFVALNGDVSVGTLACAFRNYANLTLPRRGFTTKPRVATYAWRTLGHSLIEMKYPERVLQSGSV